MGMLSAAKKEHEKKKKHPAAQAPESADVADQSDDSGQPQGGAAEDSSSEPPSQGGAAPGAGAGGTPDAPQAGGNQPTGSGEDQGSDESEGADQSQDGGDDEQSAGDDGSGGGQGGSPSGDDSGDDSTQPGGDQTQPGGDPPEAEVAQEAKDAGGSLQEFKNAVGPDGEPDFSKIPLPPALSEELHKAQQAVHAALFQNPKVSEAVVTSVTPGDQLPAAAAHMTLVIVSSVNKKLMFSKNAPQLVLPIVQWTLNNILHLVEQVRKTQIPDQQACGALGLAQEGVMRMFGVSKQHVANLKSHLPASMISKYQAHYKNAHQYATQGQQGGGQSGGPGAGGAAVNPPQQSPGGAGGPPPGGPPGGMVSQGAQAAQAQPPQGGGAEPSGPSQEETEEQE
jgi:hypothetical protein